MGTPRFHAPPSEYLGANLFVTVLDDDIGFRMIAGGHAATGGRRDVLDRLPAQRVPVARHSRATSPSSPPGCSDADRRRSCTATPRLRALTGADGRSPATRPRRGRGRRRHRVLQELRGQHAHARAAGDPGRARGRRADDRTTSTAWPATGSATPRRRCWSPSRSASATCATISTCSAAAAAPIRCSRHAAMAVATGRRRPSSAGGRSTPAREFRMGGTGRAAPDTVEFQYQVPYGYATPPQQFAMYARAYMDEYGVAARAPRPGRDQPARATRCTARGR